jgi:hypothetical protein
MKPWIVRKGTAEDVAEVMQLVRELAEYERAHQDDKNTEEAMIRDGFGT